MVEPTYFVEPDDVESLSLDWGVLKWMSTPDVTGSERLSAGVVKLEPGKGHERHTHPDSDEILYVIRGEGKQEVADQSREIVVGDMVHVPEGIEHGTINTGWEPLTLLAVYAPPGPETVLRDDPDCEVIPPGDVPVEENTQKTIE